MVLKTSLENLVIDEADLVLSFGYNDDVRKILTYLPKIHRSFLMSATLTKVRMLCMSFASVQLSLYSSDIT